MKTVRLFLLLLYVCPLAHAQQTPDGTPVLHFWEAPMPTNDRPNAAGFPLLKEAQHVDVWQPIDKSEGVYNHYAALFVHHGSFYAMWGNHLYGENGPGQRVLFSTSKDGQVWTPPAELFPSPGPMLARGETGIYLAPDRWVEVEGKLYAVAYLFGGQVSPYPIAREVVDDGSRLGAPFILCHLPEKALLPQFMPAPLYDPTLAAKIEQWYTDHDAISWWGRFDGKGISRNGVDGAKLIETFSFRSKDGVVAFMRDYSTHTPGVDRTSSNRIYASFPDGQGGWTIPQPTDIPDSHSRAQALTLPDGRVLLVGNQIAYQFDTKRYLARDPLTLSVSPDGQFFTKVFALRSGGKVKPKHRFSDIPGSGPAGYGYPSMLVHDGMIYVLYSINKEDMAITIVPLASIE